MLWISLGACEPLRSDLLRSKGMLRVQGNNKAEARHCVRPAGSGGPRSCDVALRMLAGNELSSPSPPPGAPMPLAPPPNESSLWWLGILLMLGSNVSGALGATLMKLSHNLVSTDMLLLSDSQRIRRRRRSWVYFFLGALVCQAVMTTVLPVAALSFAAQSLLSPFVASQIVFNALLSHRLLGEVLTRHDVAGTLLIVLGCAMSGIFAPKPNENYKLPDLLAFFGRAPFVVYLVLIGLLAPATYIGSRRAAEGSLLLRVCASAMPGILSGNANVFAKSAGGLVSEALHTHNWSAARKPLTWLIILAAPVLALGNLYFLNRALARLPASHVIPIYISTLIVVSTISGGLYFNEFAAINAGAAVGLAAGVLVVVAGVLVQALRNRTPHTTPALHAARTALLPEQYAATDDMSVGSIRVDVLPKPATNTSTDGPSEGPLTPQRAS